MLFINTLVECVILLGQGRRRYDNAFIVKFSMLYANYVVVSFSKFYHGVSSSMMYGKWLKESHFKVKCHDFDRLVLDTRRLSLMTHTFRLRKRCQAVSWGDVSRQRSVVCWWFLGFIVLLLKIYRKLVNTWPQNRRVRFSIKLFHPSRILSCTSAFCFPESRC